MIEWIYPWIFLLLPLPLLIQWLWPPAKNHHNAALKVPFFQHLHHFTEAKGEVNKIISGKYWLAYTTWICLILAASNPVWLGQPISVKRTGRDLMLAIDISRSMELPDMQLNKKNVDRLTALKNIANQFIAQRAGDRLGLILFGSKAYLQTPLTFDWHTVQYMLNDASIGLAGPRTALGDAIGLSIKRLKGLPEKHRVLILLTDGANNSGQTTPLDAAKLAKQFGIKIYTIGFGSDYFAINGLFGPKYINPSEDLDEDTLKSIAKITGGKYFRATNTEKLQSIYKIINHLEPTGNDDYTYRPKTPLYPWPLALALLLSLFQASFPLWKYWRFQPSHTTEREDA